MICFKRLFFACLLFTGISFYGSAARWYPELNGQYVFLERNYEVAQNRNGDWHVGIDDDNERLATVSEKKSIEELLVANDIPSHSWSYKEDWWFPLKDNKHLTLFTYYRAYKDENDVWWLDQGGDVVQALPIEKDMIGEFLKENQLEQDSFYQSLDGIEREIKKLPTIITIRQEDRWMDNLAEILQAIKLEEQLTLRSWYDVLEGIYRRGVYASNKELTSFTDESQELYKKTSALIKLTQSVAEKISPESTHQIDGYLERLNNFSKKCSDLSDLFARVTAKPAVKKPSTDFSPLLFSVYEGTNKNFSYTQDEDCKRTHAMKKAVESISKKVYLNEAGDQVNEKMGKLVTFDEDSGNWVCGDYAVNAQQGIKIKILMSAFLSSEFFFASHIDVVNPQKKNLYLYVDGTHLQYNQLDSTGAIVDPKRYYDKLVWLRDDGVFMLGDDVAEHFVSVMDAINEYFPKEYLEYAQDLKIRSNRMKAINFINCRSADFISSIYTQICQGNMIDFTTGKLLDKYGFVLSDIRFCRDLDKPNAEIVWLDIDGYWHQGEKPITFGLARMIAKILE